MDVNTLEARPGRFLTEHLVGTSKLCQDWLYFAGKKLQMPLSEIGKTVGFLHDFGKACPEFQKKLKGKKANSQLSQHAFLSAFLSYYAVKINFKSLPWYIPFLSYITVRRHHGKLQNIEEEFIFDENDKELLERQIELIGMNIFNTLMKDIGANLFYVETKRYLENFKKELLRIEDKWDNYESDLKPYVILNLLYSTLIDADRSEVIFQGEVENYSDILSSEIVDRYKSSRFFSSKESIDKIREQAYREAVDQSKEWEMSQKFISLTLPTGTGKTLIALKIALSLQEKLQKNLGISIRIIYALPFLSIIDQNFDVFKKVMNNPPSNVLLAHHHLVEANYKTPKDEYESPRSWFLIEGWNSKIIVTTFVQLFETLFSGKASNLRKFHRIFPSIIILDEIQNFPPKYWDLFREFAQYLSDTLGIWWLMVTATQPAIFDRTFELILDSQKYFKKVDRINVEFIPNRIDLQTLANLVYKSWEGKKKKIMVEVNTIGAARGLYEILEPKMDSKEIEYLSSHIIPKERRKRIERIKERKTSFILVTTQLVEAGVDIDFDEVWRDIAPWDSMVQAAGRCNRNWEQERGIINLFELYDGKDRLFASYVYDATLMDASKELIKKRNLLSPLSESDFVTLTPSYFEELKKRVSQDKGIDLLQNIRKMQYSDISTFSFIENKPNKLDVFIEYDEEAKRVWGDFLKVIQEKEIEKRKNIWLSIKNTFFSYVISVNEEWLVFLEEIGGIKYLSFDSLKKFYDRKRGFIPQKNKAEIW